MKQTTTMFSLLFMLTSMAVPLFPAGETTECCCMEACTCTELQGMSCNMDLRESETLPVLPIPAAPLNKVEVNSPATTLEQATVEYLVPAAGNSYQQDPVQENADPPSSFPRPLLI